MSRPFSQRFTPPPHVLKRLRRRTGLHRRVPEAYRPLVARWALRLIALADAEPQSLLDEPAVLELAGLDGIQPPDCAELGLAIRGRLAELEKQRVTPQGSLFQNLGRLADWVGLSDPDTEILAFAALLHTQAGLRACAALLGEVPPGGLTEILAETLRLDHAVVRSALRADSVLCASGLLQVDRTETELADTLDLLDGLDAWLLGDGRMSEAPFHAHFSAALPARLTPEDFPHLQEDIRLFQGHVRGGDGAGRTRGQPPPLRRVGCRQDRICAHAGQHARRAALCGGLRARRQQPG